MSDITSANVVYVSSSKNGDYVEATPHEGAVLFARAAMSETMLRDFNALRKAIREHDSFASEAAWEKCERWVSQLEVKTK